MTIVKSSTYILATLLAALGGAHAAEMSSTNYRISWDVADGGGGLMTSTNYVLVDSVGQPSALGAAASSSYQLQPGFHAPPDDDGDLVRSFMDNCIFDANTDQRDTNDDGYGNRCDPDIDNNGTINVADLARLKAAFLATPGDAAWDPDVDFNGDDRINLFELSVMRLFFLGSPGPSGIAP